MPPRTPAKTSGVGLQSSSLKDVLSEFIAEHSGGLTSRDSNPFGWVDIIEFCRSPYYLDIKPYPWQALMLKIIYMGSAGNKHLVVTNDPELKCENCIRHGEEIDSFAHPCLHCSACPHEKLVAELHRFREIAKAAAEDTSLDKPDLGFTVDDVEDNPREVKTLFFESPEASCEKCVWSEITNIGMRSPCLTCKLWPREKLEQFIEDRRELLIKAQVDGQDLLDGEKTFNFDTEMMLIYKDLPQDSDARRGGSVRQQVLDKIGKDFREVLLVLGRRSGKSMMVAIIALYEVYKLIEIGDPQKYHEINEGDTIDVLNAATSASVAADSVFDKIKPMVLNSPYFKKKITKDSVLKDSIRFYTPHDMEVNEKLRSEGLPPREGTVRCLSGHSNSDTLVGKNVIVVIIDEMAGMIQKDKSKMSDAELYEKLKNSVWTFDDPKILCISNPLSKDGKFYDLYERSFTNDNMIMFQLPSYISNASLTTEDLEEEKRQALANGSYQDYLMQIEARFSGGAADAFIPAAAIDAAFERGERLGKKHHGDPRHLHYMHLDPGLNSDYYALVIVHAEDDLEKKDERGRPLKHIFVDHIQLWEKDPVTGAPVDVEEVRDYIIRMTTQFRIVSITFDAWNSAETIQSLIRRGLPARPTAYSPKYQDQIYQNLLDLFLQDRITFYKHGCPFVPEADDQFKFLEKRYHKKTWTVQAVPGHHDDIPDCVAGAAFLACMGKYGYGGLPKSSTARIAWGGLPQVGMMANNRAGYYGR